MARSDTEKMIAGICPYIDVTMDKFQNKTLSGIMKTLGDRMDEPIGSSIDQSIKFPRFTYIRSWSLNVLQFKVVLKNRSTITLFIWSWKVISVAKSYFDFFIKFLF